MGYLLICDPRVRVLSGEVLEEVICCRLAVFLSGKGNEKAERNVNKYQEGRADNSYYLLRASCLPGSPLATTMSDMNCYPIPRK